MENFPSNSKMPRPIQPTPQTPAPAENEKRVEKPVVTGEVIRKKKPLGRRLVETFLSGEAPKSVFAHVAMEVLLPAARDMISNGAQEALDRILYPHGKTSSRQSTTIRQGANSVVSYNRMSSIRQDRPTVSNYARTTQNFDELLFPSRTEANAVIDEMLALLEKFNVVTVGDFFDLSGVSSEYTDRKFGWKDLRGAQPARKGGGYIVDFPSSPELLK